jgi:glutamate carboxypeptidase
VRGDRVRGQGVTDMKGGDVIVLEALRALKSAGALDDTTITVAFIGDEERVGSPAEVARASLVEAAKRSDVALAFEGTVRHNGRDTATIGRRAHGGWRLDVTAKPGHSGGIFDKDQGYGAIFEAARILDAFRRELPEENVTFSPGVVVGGTVVSYDAAGESGTAFGKSNVIPKSVVVRGDLRFLTTEQGERVKARMQEIASASLPFTQAKLTIGVDSPPMSPTPGNLRLLEIYSQASADVGLGTIDALPPGLRGGGDIQHVAPFLDCLDGLGSHGAGAHTDNEDLEIASIERATIRSAVFIYRLTHP